MKLVPVIAVGLMVSALLSGYININFQHNLHMPKELTNKNTIEETTSFYDRLKIFRGRTYNIYLVDNIPEKPFYFRDVVKLLNNAKEKDVITFYINGYGGSAQTEWVIVNAIQHTKAKTIMITDGPSYSAHAYIATSGDELIMREQSFLMFHATSTFNYNCSNMVGKDRAITLEESCNNMLKAITILNEKLIDSNKYLTQQQKEDIKAGKEVYIFPGDIK